MWDLDFCFHIFFSLTKIPITVDRGKQNRLGLLRLFFLVFLKWDHSLIFLLCYSCRSTPIIIAFRPFYITYIDLYGTYGIHIFEKEGGGKNANICCCQ
jgi:hypothetical protein